jgi:tetratricopeptide (TPR) repeat protein
MHEAARAIARSWAPPRGYFGLAESYARLGDWASVDAWLDRQEQRMPDSPFMTGQRILQQVWQGHYEEAVRLGRERLAASNQTYADLPDAIRHGAGFHLARAGDYAQAIELLEPLYDPDQPETLRAYSPEPSFGPHGLAWAYLRTGARDKADRLLGVLAQDCAGVNAAGRGRDAASLFLCAQTEVLRGDHDRALDLLEQAIEAGWRSYYIRQRDPFWAVLAEHPRYRALMARVKADVGRMRVEIQRMDAREDLGAIADADIAAEAAQGQ